jgi:glycosyltransferase involved in cell wall biosynthesis
VTSPARIAVVIPAYNLARYLGEAVESVLEQTLDPSLIEICVVDDGSTDDTRAVTARYGSRVRYLYQENRGLPATRNVGWRATTAPFVNFLDADDRLLPEKFARELALLDANPRLSLVYGGWHYIDGEGRRLPQRGWSRTEGDVLSRLLMGNLIHPHAALVRRRCLEQVGGFDEQLTSVEDWDLWLRLAAAGVQWGCVDLPLLEYRVRDDGMHANPERMLDNRLRVLEKTFETLRKDHPDRAELRARAFQHAYLEAACDHYRVGARTAGAFALRLAVRSRPALLTESRSLRQVCRLLLPLGRRNEHLVVAGWPSLAPIFKRMMLDAVPLDEHVSLATRMARRLVRWQVSARYRRKHAGSIATPGVSVAPIEV